MNQPPAESKSAGWEQTAGGHICRTHPASVKVKRSGTFIMKLRVLYVLPECDTLHKSDQRCHNEANVPVDYVKIIEPET